MARTHVVLDDDTLAAIDRLAGERGRSRFLEEAAREKLARVELERALVATAGAVDPAEHDDWGDAERAARWVRGVRAG